MQINEETTTQKVTTETEQYDANELYVIEDRNDPDFKLLKKKIKIKTTIKNMKGILV